MPFDLAILLPSEHGVAGQLGAIACREEGRPTGCGRARSPRLAQRVAITGCQVSTVVLLNHTAEETAHARCPFCRADLAGRHRHFQASPLSLTTMQGKPRISAIRSSSRATRCPNSEVSTTVAWHSRLKSSITQRMRNRRPSDSASDRKSSDHRRFGSCNCWT